MGAAWLGRASGSIAVVTTGTSAVAMRGWVRRRRVLGHPTYDDAVVRSHGELLRPLAGMDDVRRQAPRQRLGREQLLTKGRAWRLHINRSHVTRLVDLVPPLA